MLARRGYFDPFVELQREIDRLFEDFMEPSRNSRIHFPKVDIYETENEVVIEAELPGMKKDDVKITIEDGVLIIKGERKFNREDKNKNYRVIERVEGQFERAFVLPDYVDVEKISAKFNDGVLKIELPKKVEKEKKIIDIKVE
ncbi:MULTISPECIES: Hsp20/alpha crystallin family protein [unclassified Thermosipho (in: thermotogales)]|uniref:Hsp20/alpha crystallin family protein n=1 Tax=unclassified Thermosipho (in: thermotogales) TaxID=2676525 RepID=UPI00098677BC|nr:MULTISPECIES: Hsp20/alpha crystallin family protein [unclassified Thermosipho (in: thermotogales)]MBT1248200.1 heat-shock protein Hsp20 [Thermosipho sp. 1244]OOC46459.1 heat-shock protein Hsp20 [Thermosipho sp. 1223]